MSKRIAMRAATLSIAAASAVGIFASGAFAASAAARDIVEGDTGPDVVCVQQAMNNLGVARLATDGDFGPLTYNAVVAYQEDHSGLGVDGQVGPQTGGSIKEEESTHDAAQVHEGNTNNAYAQWLNNCSSLLEG